MGLHRGSGPGRSVPLYGYGVVQPDPTRQQYQKPEEASTTETPVNPMEQSAYNAASKYNNELESGNTAETTRTLAQARDELSVGMQKEGEAAIGRGADAGLFRSRALESGKRNIAKLQGDLADKAFGRRNEAINTLSSTATRAAEGQRTLHLGTMAAANADKRTQIDAADQQARLRQAPYDRLDEDDGHAGAVRGWSARDPGRRCDRPCVWKWWDARAHRIAARQLRRSFKWRGTLRATAGTGRSPRRWTGSRSISGGARTSGGTSSRRGSS
jgi:hypothetical protein